MKFKSKKMGKRSWQENGIFLFTPHFYTEDFLRLILAVKQAPNVFLASFTDVQRDP